jgi:ribosomal protein S12 methylthiotransferase
VDQYFGTTELPALLKALGADYKHELLGERLTTTQKLRLSKIAEGCDRPCSFVLFNHARKTRIANY